MKKFNFNDSFFKHVIHFSGQLYFVSNLQLSFAPEQLSALSTFNVLLIMIFNNDLDVLFRPSVSSVKDKNFPCTSIFNQVVLENVKRVLQCI